jgi:hypothetical protein
MGTVLFRHWWAVAMRGVLAILFGLVALFWPRLTLEALVIFFGAFALAGGIHAHEQGVGTIKVESLAGIRKGTTRTSRGASARKNNRMKYTWSFSQLALFITYKAA